MKRLLPRLLLAAATFAAGLSVSPSGAVSSIPPLESTALSISEVTLKRHGCDGSCPVYEVTFRSNGTASYVGYDNVDRIGSYHAKPYQFDFEQLANWIDRQGFFELSSEYNRGWVDAEVVSTTAIRGFEKKTVITYNSGEPPLLLWGIDSAIDGLASRIDWVKD